MRQKCTDTMLNIHTQMPTFYELSRILTRAVSLVAAVSHTAVLVAVAHKFLHNASPVVALEIPGVFAVRRYDHTQRRNDMRVTCRISSPGLPNQLTSETTSAPTNSTGAVA